MQAGIASTALVLAAAAAMPVSAADLGGPRGGSIKDGYVAPMPMSAPAGPCYFRGDVGYSWSQAPNVKWPVHNDTVTRVDDGSGNLIEVSRTSTFVTDEVNDVSLDNTWLAEAGVGCSFGGSRGWRIEGMLGYHGRRDLTGTPGTYTITYNDPTPPPPPDTYDDPMHSNIKTYTAMINAYKDLGNYGGFVPYIGAGVGVAYNMMDGVYFTGNPNLTNTIHGKNDISLAWALMAGVGYQLSERTILDVGYRYINMGSASTERHDNAGFVNPRVTVDDIAAHEVKVGLRYHFGGSDCCAMPVAMK
jgi:opacity protein-like surface antigen